MSDDVNDERFVMRTVYLEPEIDNRLRQIAHEQHRTKNELIAEAVTHWVGLNGNSVTSAAQPAAGG